MHSSLKIIIQCCYNICIVAVWVHEITYSLTTPSFFSFSSYPRLKYSNKLISRTPSLYLSRELQSYQPCVSILFIYIYLRLFNAQLLHTSIGEKSIANSSFRRCSSLQMWRKNWLIHIMYVHTTIRCIMLSAKIFAHQLSTMLLLLLLLRLRMRYGVEKRCLKSTAISYTYPFGSYRPHIMFNNFFSHHFAYKSIYNADEKSGSLITLVNDFVHW